MEYWKDLQERSKYENTWLVAVFAVLIIVGVVGLSFLGTAAIFYMITVILSEYFSIIVPFTWGKAFGVWALVFLVKLLFSNGTYTTVRR